VFVYHGEFSAEFIQEIQSGEKATKLSTVHRYPKDGFDIGDVQQRKDLFVAMLKLLKYCASGQVKLTPLNQGSKKVKVSPHYGGLRVGRTNQRNQSNQRPHLRRNKIPRLIKKTPSPLAKSSSSKSATLSKSSSSGQSQTQTQPR